MEDRDRGVSSQLTVDHLLARLDHLERAYAALQQAYVELQSTAREQRRAPLVGDVLASVPMAEPAAHVCERVGAEQSVSA